MLSACDASYSLKLIGRMDLLAWDAGTRFAALLSGYTLAGGIGKGSGQALGVHKTAYALGVLNLLAAHGQPVQHDALRAHGWLNHELLDARHRPRWLGKRWRPSPRLCGGSTSAARSASISRAWSARRIAAPSMPHLAKRWRTGRTSARR